MKLETLLMLTALALVLGACTTRAPAPEGPANGSFTASLNGFQIHYEVHGQGPVLMTLPNSWGLSLEGLRKSVSEDGTGHHITLADGTRLPIFNAHGVTVWGKTGTAQAPPLRAADTNGDGEIDGDDEGREGLDHAWFVGLVGPGEPARPRYAIAVIVEYGGSGGKVAGPVANQIVHALQAEGYLPEPPAEGDDG